MLGRDARELWLEVLLCGRYKSTYLNPSSAPVSSTERKVNQNLYLNTSSTNEDSTNPSTVERTITSETSTYVINYVEFSEKADLSKESGSDSDESSTPDPSEMSEQEFEAEEEKECEQERN